ncbi:MAG: TIM barrel protein [archaeon]|nr:TIM barrel protein [archaeon]
MGLKIGISGIPIIAKGSDTLSGIQAVKDLGLDLIELQFVRNIYLDDDGAREVGALAKKLGVSVTCHASYFINLSSQKEDVQSASVKRILDTLHIGDILGSRLIVVHPGYYSQRTPSEAFDLIKRNVDEAVRRNRSKVLVGLETTGRQKAFGTVDEIIGVCRECKGTCPVIDFGHIHALTDGGLKTRDDFSSIFEKFEKELGLDWFHIHMSCMNYKDGNEKSHAPLSTFEPDFHHMADVIKENGYDCSIVCESPLLEHDALLFKKWFYE